MKRSRIVLGILTGALALGALARIQGAWGDEGHTADAPREGSSSSMIRTYAGPMKAHIGEFTGKLVCLRCDLKPSAEATSQCAKEGHRHALSMDSGSMIHPLLAGTDDVLKEINSDALHDKQVTVHGKHYPSTGVILVDSIAAAK